MNKFEKLIEYIINDEDQKARDLFHTIVVEKSRDIYESIMDEEQVEENFGGPVAGEQVEELTNQLADEEAVGEADEEGEEEFSLDQDGEDDEMGGEMPAEVGHDEEAEEDKIMNIDAKLDELLAKFDEIMGDTGSDEMGAEMPSEEPSMDDMGAEQEPQMFEADESDEEDCDDEEESDKEDKKEEAKESRNNSRKLSTSELMREYVDRIGDIYGGQGDAAEGDAVAGSGKKTSVNTKSVTGPGADFGGTAVKVTKGSESNPDGTSAPSSDKPQEIKSGNINVPGGKAGSSFKNKEAAKSGEGQTTDGSVPTNDKSPVRK